MQLQQRTLAEKVTCLGTGLHTGAPASVTLKPARANTGICFLRRGRTRVQTVRAHPDSVSSTSHATRLGFGAASVSTVEHLLAALYAFGVSNVQIEVDGPEVPIMDGSAADFVRLIRAAGVYEQREELAYLEINERIEVVDGARSISIEPAFGFSITYAVDFAHPAIGRQELVLPHLDAESFDAELARARTFGFLSEVEALRRAGLARGGSLNNTVVLDANQVINPEGLRFPDEYVRHKALDLIGDLSLLGLPLCGHVRVERGGHQMHHRLVREILSRRQSWSLCGADASAAHRLDLVAESVPVLGGVPESRG